MKNQFIALMVEEKPSLIVCLQAILKSGNTFVPINSIFPNERIQFIINDCNIKVVLTDNIHYQRVLQIFQNSPNILHILCIDSINGELIEKQDIDNIERDGKTAVQKMSTSFCYVIYTSGSTGLPKGVPITHQNLIPLLLWFKSYFQLNGNTKIFHNLSYTFDFGVFEILTTNICGGSIHMLDKKTGNFTIYADFIRTHSINTIHTTPVFFTGIVNTGRKIPCLQIVHLGGENLTGTLTERVRELTSKKCRIYNGYGPTEATINCSIYLEPLDQTPNADRKESIPIGKPSALNQIYILNIYHQLQPIGAAGELCVTGIGLAKGYLNRPELTAERFKKYRSYRTNKTFICYKTGDLARWLNDGNIQFLGRIDQQVKIRGYRIELGEIENCLLKNNAVKETAVIARQDKERGQRYLCAYIIFQEGTAPNISVSELREYLLNQLPDYMIPSYFIKLEKIPLTANGKLDHRALPAPSQDIMMHGVGYTAPANEIEQKIAVIWKEILGLERIGREDNFFESGGDSILATQCIARLREEFKVDLSLRKIFEYPSLKALSKEVTAQQEENNIFSIKKVPRNRHIPLSFSQERLWFLQELDADNVAYFVPRIIKIKGKLDVYLIERTFTEIIRRHEILRTVFPTIDGQPEQQIQPPYQFKIPVLDWSRLEKEEQEKEVSEFLHKEGRRPFDFEKGPLLRITILKLKEEEHLFVLTDHHLVHDGWTQGVLLREFIAIFTAYAHGKEHHLPQLPIQYADFAVWQRNYLTGPVLESHLSYWKENLAGLAPVLELPANRPRPPIMSGMGQLEIVHMPGSYTLHLKEFSRINGVTLFMTMLTAFKILLYRYTGVEDLCVGTGIANRKYKEMEGMLGMVINTLPLRTPVQGEFSFKECLHRVKETCLGTYQHEDTPFGKIVEVMQPERNLSYMPIFQVLFSFMDTPAERLQLPGLELELLPTHNRSAKFDINVVVAPPPEREENEMSETLVEWEYNTDIFDTLTIKQMISHYNRLLESGVNRPEIALSNLPMLEDIELKKILFEFNDTVRPYPCEKTIDELFVEQVKESPDRIALVEHSVYLTYCELNEKSNYLTQLLIEKGVRVDNIVGIMMVRSIEVIVGMLGILKSGGAYLPINPGYPQERIAYMLKDSGAKLVIGRAEERKSGRAEFVFSCFFPASPLPCFLASDSSNLAYIIYTSGTTGRPKGVMAAHQGVVRLTKNTNYLIFNREDRILPTGALEFDISTFEIWGPLLNGLSMYLIAKDILLNVETLKNILNKYRITILHLIPQLFNKIVEQHPHIFQGLRYLLVGGDRVNHETVEIVRKNCPDVRILHMYGPTENTTFSSFLPVEKFYETGIPIGKPISNSTAYILDKHGYPVPLGVIGELWVGGDGVSRGYLNNPELTCEKFKINRFYRSNKTYILYKTGDLARWLWDGNIEFLGRIDYQIKVRGFRIELGEIESRLASHDEIKEVVLMAVNNEGESEDKDLCAYFTSQKKLDTSELRKYLEREFPSYMIPAYFVQLEKMPLALNGKLDRNALPMPQLKKGKEFVAPLDEIEVQMVEIWSSVLGIKKEIIGIQDNFFHLGGHSLKATLLTGQIAKMFNVKFSLTDVFTGPTVREMSAVIRQGRESFYEEIQPIEEREYYPQSSAQKRLFFLEQFENIGTTYNISSILKIEGKLDFQGVHGAIKKMIRRHEILRTSFKIIANEPVQIVHKQVDSEIENYTGSSGSSVEEIIRSFIRPFDLSRAPLFRVGLISLAGESYLLLCDLHHIAGDGISMEILINDLMAFYDGNELPTLNVQYKDFTSWQNDMSKSPEIEKQEKYWLGVFAKEIPKLNFPTDYPRPENLSFKGDRYFFTLEGEDADALHLLAVESGATLFMVLLAAFNVLLYKYCGQSDIIVGTGIMGRPHAYLHRTIGMFVNSLAIRNYPSGEKTFRQFLSEVRENCIRAFANQDFQFEGLVGKLKLARDNSRNPLFDVLLVVQNFEQTKFNDLRESIFLKDVTITPYRYENKTSKFDLNLAAWEAGSNIQFRMEYATSLFKPSTIVEIVNNYTGILKQVMKNRDMLLSGLAISNVLMEAKPNISQMDKTEFTF